MTEFGVVHMPLLGIGAEVARRAESVMTIAEIDQGRSVKLTRTEAR